MDDSLQTGGRAAQAEGDGNARGSGALAQDDRAAEVVEAVPAPEGDGERVVVARDLRRRYGSGDAAVDALRGASVDLFRGQFTAVMGPSGSGKSTLMHILAGLDEATSGDVWIEGVKITGMNDRELTQLRRDKVGFIFQQFNLLPMLTGEENVTLPLEIAGRKADDEWMARLIEAVGLADRKGHRPAEMSGGQQQRVAIVMVTHDPHAATIADRILFLQDGRIVLDRGKMQRDEIYDIVKSLESGGQER